MSDVVSRAYVGEDDYRLGFEDSVASEVTITALSGQRYAEMQVLAASDIVAGLPSEAFRKKNDQKHLLQDLSKILKELAEGDLDKAAKKLTKVLAELDGCSLRTTADIGGAFKKDSIIDCTPQVEVDDLLVSARDAIDNS